MSATTSAGASGRHARQIGPAPKAGQTLRGAAATDRTLLDRSSDVGMKDRPRRSRRAGTQRAPRRTGECGTANARRWESTRASAMRRVCLRHGPEKATRAGRTKPARPDPAARALSPGQAAGENSLVRPSGHATRTLPKVSAIRLIYLARQECQLRRSHNLRSRSLYRMPSNEHICCSTLVLLLWVFM